MNCCVKSTRVLCILGTRPEAIKMAPVIKALSAVGDEITPLVCVTAQHRQMLDQVLSLFRIVPDVDLDLMTPGQTLADLTARALTGINDVLRDLHPDLVLVQGDTTTVLAAALAAYYKRVPVGHVEAGLRTYDRYNPFPEEINRRLASALAILHFAPTQTAAHALASEGIAPDTIHVTGNTVIDALHWAVRQPVPGEVQTLLRNLGCAKPNPTHRLILVTAHRRENWGVPLEQICLGLRALARRNPDIVILYPVHLNPQVREPVQRLLAGQERVALIEPLSYLPFAHVMSASTLVLTDSGGIQEEAPSLGIPVLVLRRETERPEAVEAGAVKLVGPEAPAIVQESEHLLYDPLAYASMTSGQTPGWPVAVSPYGDGHAAERITAIIQAWARQQPHQKC